MARQTQPAARRAPIGLRLSEGELRRIDTLVESYGEGVTTRHKLSKKCLLMGVDLLESQLRRRSRRRNA